MFYIEIKGKKHFYNNIESATKAANEVFKKTNIVLGIFRTETD